MPHCLQTCRQWGICRSLDIQTGSFLETRTESTWRGTPVYMAPEIQLEELKMASQEDLQKADIWSLGLLMYSLINPNLTNPYRGELEQAGISFTQNTMKDLLRRKQLPGHDIKYADLRKSQWQQLEDVLKNLASCIVELHKHLRIKRLVLLYARLSKAFVAPCLVFELEKMMFLWKSRKFCISRLCLSIAEEYNGNIFFRSPVESGEHHKQQC